MHDEPVSIRKQINGHVCPHGQWLLATEGTEYRHPLSLAVAWKHLENMTFHEGPQHGGPRGTLRSREVSREGTSMRWTSWQWLLGPGRQRSWERLSIGHGSPLGKEKFQTEREELLAHAGDRAMSGLLESRT